MSHCPCPPSPIKSYSNTFNKIRDHPEGFHGHYNRKVKQLVDKEHLNNLTISSVTRNGMSQSDQIFLKYYSATKKLEHTLISNKDFVSVNDEEGIF